jgi:hypothetical protein
MSHHRVARPPGRVSRNGEGRKTRCMIGSRCHTRSGSLRSRSFPDEPGCPGGSRSSMNTKRRSGTLRTLDRRNVRRPHRSPPLAADGREQQHAFVVFMGLGHALQNQLISRVLEVSARRKSEGEYFFMADQNAAPVLPTSWDRASAFAFAVAKPMLKCGLMIAGPECRDEIPMRLQVIPNMKVGGRLPAFAKTMHEPVLDRGTVVSGPEGGHQVPMIGKIPCGVELERRAPALTDPIVHPMSNRRVQIRGAVCVCEIDVAGEVI